MGRSDFLDREEMSINTARICLNCEYLDEGICRNVSSLRYKSETGLFETCDRFYPRTQEAEF